MPRKIIRPHTTVQLGTLRLSGTLVFEEPPGRLTLETDEGPEYLETNLSAYGYVPEPGNIFVKDWSEHSGLAQSLEDADVAEFVRRIEIPMTSWTNIAYEMRVITAAEVAAREVLHDSTGA